MLKIYLHGKFVNFESFRSGIFQIEFSLYSGEKNKVDFSSLNFCVANSQRLYDEANIDKNPIAFFKKIVEEKKQANLNLSIINQINEDLTAFILNNLNKFLNLKNLKEIFIEDAIEDDLKTLINKRIASQVVNSTDSRFAFIYIAKTLNEQEETELKKKHFQSDHDEDDDEVFHHEDINVDYQEYDLVLSPSKGIFIFLLEPGDIIFVKPSIDIDENEEDDEDDDESKKNKLIKKQEMIASTPSLKATVKSVNFENDVSEIIIVLADGNLGRVEEKEMVKVKGIKPKDLNLENEKSEKKSKKARKRTNKARELRRNLMTLLVLVVIFIFIIYVLSGI